MITDEEIKQLVRSVADKNAVDPFDSNGEFATLNFAELKAIYQLGRQHQRESDAALCIDRAQQYEAIEPFACHAEYSESRACAKAIRNNKES